MSSRSMGISHPKFIQDLAYTFGSDVSASGWKRSSGDTRKAYDFSYDGLHRLKDAAYKEGSSVKTATPRRSPAMTATAISPGSSGTGGLGLRPGKSWTT